MKATMVLLLLGATNVFCQTVAGGKTEAKSTSEKYAVPRLDIANVDTSVDPCVDFYAYACGNWIKNNPIPTERTVWVSFNEVQEHNYAVLRNILQKAAIESAQRSAIDQKIGDFYSSCMDEEQADRRGYSPLEPEMSRIAEVKDKVQMMAVMAHEYLIGPNPLFNFYTSPDLHNAELTVAVIDQGGLSLPDRDYYLKDDSDLVTIRKAFTEHMTRMFGLIGQTPAQAAQSSATVMRIETALAGATADRILRRDPKALDHKMTLGEIGREVPHFHLDYYFPATGAPAFTELNVSNPDFFKAVDRLIQETPLDDWKLYMTWQVLNHAAPWLSKEFVQEDFAFQRVLTGRKALQARWKRCIRVIDDQLGDALGQRYVEETFGAEGKLRMLKMVATLEQALRNDIISLSWMTEQRRSRLSPRLPQRAIKSVFRTSGVATTS